VVGRAAAARTLDSEFKIGHWMGSLA